MKIILIAAILMLTYRCTGLVLTPADFAWPVEAVVSVTSKGAFTEERHTFTLNVKPLYFEEFADSNKGIGQALRIIRDRTGYYYFVGKGFKNVYMFTFSKDGLKLANKIKISDSTGVNLPAFNQKQNSVELIDGSDKYLINGTKIMRTK